MTLILMFKAREWVLRTKCRHYRISASATTTVKLGLNFVVILLLACVLASKNFDKLYEVMDIIIRWKLNSVLMSEKR